MRFVNLDHRLVLTRDGHGADVHDASGGGLPPTAAEALRDWDSVSEWAKTFDGPMDVEVVDAQLGPPSPAPAQIFAVGVNYADHGAESGLATPDVPLVFPKLLPSLAGPYADVALSAAHVDWEVELVVVIGRQARRVAPSAAWDHVAGLTAGQDLSDREIQFRPKSNPQFSLGKSLPGFGPIGPALVTPDEFGDPDDLELACWVNGEEVQRDRTSRLIYPVSELIAYLSGVTTLYPGDLIFTGTPSGVGMALSPPRYLKVGDVVESYLEGVGRMSQRFVAPEDARDPLVERWAA
jgi:2-keto-4-pentenoate hydratase/2-oxohepta-3-ene-1,7-dioic acid hydratase in catechol pathway